MNRKELKYFDALLQAKRTELLRQLEYIEKTSMKNTPQDSAGNLSSVAYHMADQASDAAEQERAFLFASREGRYLHHIEEALSRIVKGKFGICRICGMEISRERLKAVPHATMCIQCKSKEEKSGSKYFSFLVPEKNEDDILL